ncbi:MAG TPA: hypothetical protein VIA06_09465 [Candidatus Dormibacteraeota bacterium]|nr:hypothetical protein [Candidatus Dormibacteraeota bacterium]
MLAKTVSICAAGAVLVLIAFIVLGSWRWGLGGAAGLLLGSVNAVLIGRSVDSSMSFLQSSLLRLLMLTVLGVGIGFLLGGEAVIFVMAGIAAAELIMAGVAVREVSRA